MIFDLVCLFILIICSIYYARKGLLAGIFSFVGGIVAVVASTLIARALALPIFDQFFRPSLEKSVAEAIAEYSAITVEELMANVASFLPQAAVDAMSQQLGDTSGLTPDVFAARVIEDVVQPLVIPIITIIVFLVLFALLRVLLGMLISVFTSANRLPLLGTANKALGAVMGVLVGAFYIFLAVVILSAFGVAFGDQGDGPFDTSFVYGLLSENNFLIT